MVSAQQAATMLDELLKELNKRRQEIDTLDRAYRGDFNLHYATDDFRTYHADRYKEFSDNWCAIVADAPHERLEVTGIQIEGETKFDKELWRDWNISDSPAFSDLAFLDAIIAKRAFAIVWGNSDDEPVVSWEHPSQCVVTYDPETRARKAGAKFWSDETHDYATLYLPDEVWKFQRANVRSGRLILPSHMQLAGGWMPRETDTPNPLPNPMGKVAMVELVNRPRLLGDPHSDIAGALAMQHAVNLLWAQLFVVADDNSYPQRVVMGAEMPMLPVLNDAGQVVGEKPIDLKQWRSDRAKWIEDPGAKIGEWKAADLKLFTDVIEIAIGHIAAQTRTPAHYLLIGGTIANIAEGAMKALETGLVKRTGEKTQHFGRGVRDVFELMALAKDRKKKARAIREGGTTQWRDVENRSDAQRADALAKKRTIGYPLRYLLELDGLSKPEVERVMAMVREEQEDPVLQRIGLKFTQQGTPEAAPSEDARDSDTALGA